MEQNLSLYHIFNAVAQTGNISHASNLLFISQPAISKSILKLEENLGVTLFTRNSRGVQLTKSGELLYEYTKSAFTTLEQGEELLRRNQELGYGHLRIGVSTTLCKYILLPYLKVFVHENPHIKVTIECQSTFQTLELLESGKIDVGLIGRSNNLKNTQFYFTHAIEDTFVAAKSYLENLSIREQSPLTFYDIFKTANIMLLDEKNMTRLFIEDYFTSNQIETNQILEVSNMDLLIEFAKIGLGVSCVIKEFIKVELAKGDLVEIPLKNPLDKREIGFAHSTTKNKSESLKKFIKFITEREYTSLLPKS